jgi:hypothetical protein
MSKVLVLGAGASHAYNYPLGSGLRAKILAISEGAAREIGILRSGQSATALSEFQRVFRESQMYSIDAFLGRQPHFAEIGKRCIASILLQSESKKTLFSEPPDKDHWYQYFFNHVARKDWEDLSFGGFAIVTFNYDRSLEHFLFTALKATYGIGNDVEIVKKLKGLRIVHVYGSLCSQWPSESGCITYDGVCNPEKLELAAEGIVVVPEGRTNSQELCTAREWLTQASGICFLGFGYDETNVDRLAAGNACRTRQDPSTGRTRRPVVGSCYGMTLAEIKNAWIRLTGTDVDQVPNGVLYSENCTRVLRETRFLQA